MADPQRPSEPQPLTILLIEDAAEDARLMQEALAGQRDMPVQLVHATRLSAGLQRLSEGGVDMVLLDLVLPDSEGMETLIKVRHHAPRVPVVVLTASDDGALAVQALQQGAQDYLVKASVQASRDLLARSIRYAIERHRAERLKDEFVSTVSHELRTPLSTIQEFTAILIDELAGSLTNEQREYLGIIRANIQRLTRMIDNLLDMARIDAGHAVLRKAVTDIAPLVQQTVQSMHPLAKNKGLELEVRLPGGLPSLYADADKITQVLINLISNAIKFTPGPGRVTVSVSEGENDLTFSVADTGVGIAADDVPKLFEKFSRVHHLVNDEGTRGTGLGLAISKRLIELHGGQIGVTSRPDKGSTFTFTLPKYHETELFHELFASGIEKAKQQQGRFSIVVVSVQSFQELRRQYGLEETTRLLNEVEEALRWTVRRRDGGDLVLRWRRGEMVVVLAEADQKGAHAMGQRVKRVLEQRQFAVGHTTIRLPFLVVTATYPDEGTTELELLRLTERRLQQPDQAKGRIMVVDDEPKIRKLLREALELQHYDVFTAASGPDALAQLRRQPVDLVLLDLMMPVMDGYEVYHLLKENPQTKEVPVIIVTAKGERKDRQLGINGASYNYLAKPFEIDTLLAKVREVLVQQPVKP